MSKEQLPNPFEAARPLGGISVMLKPEDVMHLRPDLSAEEIEKLLSRSAPAIAARMFSAGMEAAAHILNGDAGDA